uniref:RNase H type-1 domain-containing protein n=1 Tax=Davidia involucrata TaxID=16924 RepID=A0A5B7A5M0_DAVIN
MRPRPAQVFTTLLKQYRASTLHGIPQGIDDLLLNYEKYHSSHLHTIVQEHPKDVKQIFKSPKVFMELYMRTPIVERAHLFESMRLNGVTIKDDLEPETVDWEADRTFPFRVLPRVGGGGADKSVPRYLPFAFCNLWDMLQGNASWIDPSCNGGGFVARDFRGEVLGFEFFPLSESTPRLADFGMLEKGVDWLVLHGYKLVNLGLDNETIVSVLRGQGRISVDVVQYNRICLLFDSLLRLDNFNFTHTPREMNQVANHLAFLGRLVAEGQHVEGKHMHKFAQLVEDDFQGKPGYKWT